MRSRSAQYTPTEVDLGRIAGPWSSFGHYQFLEQVRTNLSQYHIKFDDELRAKGYIIIKLNEDLNIKLLADGDANYGPLPNIKMSVILLNPQMQDVSQMFAQVNTFKDSYKNKPGNDLELVHPSANELRLFICGQLKDALGKTLQEEKRTVPSFFAQAQETAVPEGKMKEENKVDADTDVEIDTSATLNK